MPEIERIYVIPLKKMGGYKASRAAPTAMKRVKQFLSRHMKTSIENIWIDDSLNKELWRRGKYKMPNKIRVRAVKFEDGVVEAYLPEIEFKKSKRELLLEEKEKKKPILVKEEEVEEEEEAKGVEEEYEIVPGPEGEVKIKKKKHKEKPEEEEVEEEVTEEETGEETGEEETEEKVVEEPEEEAAEDKPETEKKRE